jgi:hypothetical protein
MVAGGKNLWAALRSGYGSAPRSQAERLVQAVAMHNIRVRSAACCCTHKLYVFIHHGSMHACQKSLA